MTYAYLRTYCNFGVDCPSRFRHSRCAHTSAYPTHCRNVFRVHPPALHKSNPYQAQQTPEIRSNPYHAQQTPEIRSNPYQAQKTHEITRQLEFNTNSSDSNPDAFWKTLIMKYMTRETSIRLLKLFLQVLVGTHLYPWSECRDFHQILAQ